MHPGFLKLGWQVELGEKQGSESGRAAAVQVVDDRTGDAVANPEARAGVAEQPAGAVDRADELAAADCAADCARAGDEGGAVQLVGARAEESEQVVGRADLGSDAERRETALNAGH